MYKFVWDASAIANIKELDINGYSPSYSLYKDLSDGIIDISYQNIFPALAVFEVNATISRKKREDIKILRDFYLFDDNSILYDIDKNLILKSNELFSKKGFDKLRGMDLVFACIAYIEDAYLVTLDKGFKKHVSEHIKIIDLNDSRDNATYRELFE